MVLSELIFCIDYNVPIKSHQLLQDLRVMKNVQITLVESVLILLRLTAVASAADAGIYTKVLGSRVTATTLITIKRGNERHYENS